MKKKTHTLKIGTAIPNLTDMINKSTEAICTYKLRPGLLECEDYLYSIEEHKARNEIKAELIKAKQLMRTQKGWRLKVLKQTKFNPIKLFMLFLAWAKNRKHGNKH